MNIRFCVFLSLRSIVHQSKNIGVFLGLLVMGILSVHAEIFLGQGSMVGEVDQTSAILQSRLTASEKLVEGDVSGHVGVARFEISAAKDFKQVRRTPWLKAQAASDFIVKIKVTGLKPATRYFYRVVYGFNKSNAHADQSGRSRHFKRRPVSKR